MQADLLSYAAELQSRSNHLLQWVDACSNHLLQWVDSAEKAKEKQYIAFKPPTIPVVHQTLFSTGRSSHLISHLQPFDEQSVHTAAIVTQSCDAESECRQLCHGVCQPYL